MDPQENIVNRLKLLDEQNQRLDRQAKILVEEDIKIRQAYEDLEKAYHELKIEKESILVERNKLAVVLSAITDAVIVLDLSRNVLLFNFAAESFTAFPAKEALGKPIGQIIRLFDGDKELTDSTYCPTKADDFEGIVFNRQNLKLVGQSGTEKFVNLIVGKIKEGNRMGLGCILTLHDTTEEEQLEEMKLDFVSMAAHELRTPLTSIRGYLSVFMNDFVHKKKRKLTKEQKMFLNRINISVQQLMSLVDNLLSVSRIEKGGLNIYINPVDWFAMLKQTVNGFTDRARERKLELILIDPAQPLPQVLVDRLRISEVLDNLIANAISYTNPGGRIKVWVDVGNNEIVTHVQDTGEGIPKEGIPHLFTKFFRVSGKLEQGSKGTGLGLYISRSIVEMHHGKIWVDSELGKGSTFSFSLPIEAKTQGQNN